MIMKTKAILKFGMKILHGDGIIEIDTEPAKLLGFTSDKFEPCSYLWRKGNTIIISAIMSETKGAFRELMETIQQLGFDFEIPTPSLRMREIAAKQGWIACEKDSEIFGVVEVLTNIKAKLGGVADDRHPG